MTPLALPPVDHIAWQPICHLTTGTILGHEALARFADRTPPEAFALPTPTAIQQLDAVCLHEALANVPPTGLVFLNMTPASIQQARWPTIPPPLQSRVVIELPESAGWDPAMVPPSLMVALDDVGAGFHELQRVYRIPWRFLKLDIALVQASQAHDGLQQLIRDLVRQAQRRSGYVIAEGIETPRMAYEMTQLGVTHGQGFLWGVPH